jgi:hypothetical protein
MKTRQPTYKEERSNMQVPDAFKRVKKGVSWLDGAADRGKCPRNWRRYINLDQVRFANLDKTIPAAIFGKHFPGLRKLGTVGLGEDLGFFAYKIAGDLVELRRAWESALKSTGKWEYHNLPYRQDFIRSYYGVTYVIYLRETGDWGVVHSPSPSILFSRRYKTAESAKRAVRKHIKENPLLQSKLDGAISESVQRLPKKEQKACKSFMHHYLKPLTA